MNEEEKERRQQILEAAFAEFSSKGFERATIKSIAKAAGLQSPSLIYWYFSTKEELLQAVIIAQSPFFQTAFNPEGILDLPPETLLPMMAQGYLYMVQQPTVQQMARLLFSEALRRPELSDMISQNIMGHVLNFLKTYFTHQIAVGHLRPHDVRASARAFIGMLVPYALGLVLFPGLNGDNLTADEHIATNITIFLNGLKANQP